jgi:hypothetical protein
VPEDRQLAIDLIDEAVTAGARCFKACLVLEVDVRTLQRWTKAVAGQHGLADRRKAVAAERTPANKLSDEEREVILTVCNQMEFQSLPPSQIVPRLADKGEYIASESSFYRVLRAADQQYRRGRSNPPRTVPKPEGFLATGPNQIWSWDITFLGIQHLWFLLPALSGARYIQSQDCRLGGPRERVGGACQFDDPQGLSGRKYSSGRVGTTCGQWRPHERSNHAGNAAEAGHCPVLQSAISE